MDKAADDQTPPATDSAGFGQTFPAPVGAASMVEIRCPLAEATAAPKAR